MWEGWSDKVELHFLKAQRILLYQAGLLRACASFFFRIDFSLLSSSFFGHIVTCICAHSTRLIGEAKRVQGKLSFSIHHIYVYNTTLPFLHLLLLCFSCDCLTSILCHLIFNFFCTSQHDHLSFLPFFLKLASTKERKRISLHLRI